MECIVVFRLVVLMMGVLLWLVLSIRKLWIWWIVGNVDR